MDEFACKEEGHSVPQEGISALVVCVVECRLLQLQLFLDVLGQGILVDKDVHGLVGDEGFGGVPDTFVLTGFTP